MRCVWWSILPLLVSAQDEKPKKDPGFLGVSSEEIEPEGREKAGLKPGEAGVRLSNINPNTAAEKAGLKTGDIILTIDGEKIEDTSALSKIIQAKGAGTEITLAILREGQRQEIKAKLGGRPSSAGGGDPVDKFPPAEPSDEPLRKLAAKCGTDIPWITIQGSASATLDEAKKQAADKKRLILWYVFRIPGAHIQRYGLLDRYMNSGPFSDADVADLIRRKFIPLRLTAAQVGTAFGLKALDVMEPAIVLMRPDGSIAHRLERLRSMNAEYILETLRLTLEKEPELNLATAADAAELIKGGDYAKAAERIGPEDHLLRGILLRRQFKADEALESLKKSNDPEARVEEGIVLLKSGRISDAKKTLETLATPRARYHLGVCEFLSGHEKKAGEIWTKLAETAPDSPWAWRSAACASGPKDCFFGESGLTHGYEDPLWPVPFARGKLLPGSECPRPAADAKDVARDAVRWLLRHQLSNGSWPDSRYIFGQGPVIQPNVWMAVTAMACSALLEWREVDPEGIDSALARALPYLLDEANINRGKYETSYADAFRLVYFSKRIKAIPAEKEKLLREMNGIVERLAKLQGKGGFWWHEYPNCFITGMAMVCLDIARKAGADVPKDLLDRGVAGLQSTRSAAGTWPYATRGRSSEKNSSGRMPLCEFALFVCESSNKENVEKALEAYLKHHSKLNTVRKSDYHADEELAGFFYFHSMWPATEACKVLAEGKRAELLKRILDVLVSLPEIDGSFAEDHEVGKSYSTAMALLCLKNCLQ